MPLAQFGLLALFVSAMVGSPGPANMSLMANSMSFGARPALPFMLGTMSGFQVIYWLNVAGLFALLKAAPEVFDVLRVLCLGYILYLAWVIVRSPVQAGSKAGHIPDTAGASGCIRSIRKPMRCRSQESVSSSRPSATSPMR